MIKRWNVADILVVFILSHISLRTNFSRTYYYKPNYRLIEIHSFYIKKKTKLTPPKNCARAVEGVVYWPRVGIWRPRFWRNSLRDCNKSDKNIKRFAHRFRFAFLSSIIKTASFYSTGLTLFTNIPGRFVNKKCFT